MLVFIKLGGSLITDKKIESSFRQDVMTRLAGEIATALQQQPDLRLVIGHGSGSFGHFAAKRYGTINGVRTVEEWRAFAHVATVAAELNHLVAKTLDASGVPVWRIQPSASAYSRDGDLTSMVVFPVKRAVEYGIVPLVYGDVSLDETRGGTIISTERVLSLLAASMSPQRILLLGEVEGVYDTQQRVIPEITPANIAEVEEALGGSAGTDVTGGMETKVRDMLSLTQRIRGLTIRVMDGTQPELLQRTLLDEAHPGTVLKTTS
jgi:isopentenyl phosphate kinase